MSTHDPSEQERIDQFEAEQADRLLDRTAQLETELVIANQKLQALQEFMGKVRSHDGELEDWLIEQQINGNYPGADQGLHVMQDGQVRFLDLNA